MLTKPTGQVGTPSSQLSEASRASAPIASDEVMGLDPRATSSDPRLYQVILDRISHGVTFFDGQQRLILCNRRYAEIYRLAPEDVRPGTTLSEIAERRIAVGNCPMVTEDVRSFLAWNNGAVSSAKPSTWDVSAQRRSDNPNGLSAYD
jgi:PAS domain-containing protein